MTRLSAGTDKYNFRYLLKLSGVSVLLQILAWTISTFPFFQLFAITPIIAICYYDLSWKKRLSLEFITLITLVFLIPSLVKLFIFETSPLGFIANISPSFVFILWRWSSTIIGSLRSLYLLVFWSGVEYVFITLDPPIFYHLPAGAFRLWGESLVYIGFTGFQGTTIWVLVTNLLFQNSIFTNRGTPVSGLKRSRFLLASLFGVIPMAVSMIVYSGTPDGDLTAFFASPEKYWTEFNYNPFYSFYLDNGEYIGKLGFWLAIALILSLVVRHLRTLWK